MEPLTYFDCNSSLGRRGIVHPGSFVHPEDLIDKMDRYGIERALVYHSLAREYDPAAGNRMLMDELARLPANRLAPVWVVMPHHTGEFPHPRELVGDLKTHGVRAVAMFPSAQDHGYSLADWNCGELFGTLESCRIPLFIGWDQFGGEWNVLHALCAGYPQLPVVLTGVTYRLDRNLYPLLHKCGNLRLELSGYKVHNGIEEICARFSAHRVLFGSGMPVFSGASAAAMLNYARISRENKERIARRNLEQLLEEVRL